MASSGLIFVSDFIEPAPWLLVSAILIIVITAVVWGIGVWQDAREDGIGYLRAMGRSIRESGYGQPVTTIQQLDGEDWGDPESEGTSLIRRCTELRRIPLAEFTVEDLRIMLGQGIAVPILLPLALDVLIENPLAEGDFYPGDLLWAVLRLLASDWTVMPSERQRLSAAVAAVDLAEADLPPEVQAAVIAVRQTIA